MVGMKPVLGLVLLLQQLMLNAHLLLHLLLHCFFCQSAAVLLVVPGCRIGKYLHNDLEQ